MEYFAIGLLFYIACVATIGTYFAIKLYHILAVRLEDY